MLTKEQQEAVERLKRAVVGFPGRFSADIETLIALTEAPDSPDQPAAFTDALASAQADPAWVAKWRVPEAEAVEPVAWKLDHCEFGTDFYENEADVCSDHQLFGGVLTPLYTHPPTIQADLDRAVEALEEASVQLHRLMRTAEMSSGIMLDRKRTGDWPGAQRTADAFDRIGLSAAEAKAAVRKTLATITKASKP